MKSIFWYSAGIFVMLGALVGCPTGSKSLADYARALRAYADGDEQQAIALLMANEGRRPRLAQSALLLGRIHFLGGRPQEGERFLRRALQRDPQSVDARKWLARLLLDGRSDTQSAAALAILEPAFTHSGEDAELYVLMARAQRAVGDVSAALASFEQARALYSRAVEVALELADLYRAAGLNDRSQAELRRAMRLAQPGSSLAEWLTTTLAAEFPPDYEETEQ